MKEAASPLPFSENFKLTYVSFFTLHSMMPVFLRLFMASVDSERSVKRAPSQYACRDTDGTDPSQRIAGDHTESYQYHTGADSAQSICFSHTSSHG
jgi:hypothetical protein